MLPWPPFQCCLWLWHSSAKQHTPTPCVQVINPNCHSFAGELLVKLRNTELSPLDPWSNSEVRNHRVHRHSLSARHPTQWSPVIHANPFRSSRFHRPLPPAPAPLNQVVASPKGGTPAEGGRNCNDFLGTNSINRHGFPEHIACK